MTKFMKLFAFALLLVAVGIFIQSCEKQAGPVDQPASVGQGQVNAGKTVSPNDVVPSSTKVTSPRRTVVISCPEDKFCGPMDVAFLIDDTGSMGGAIDNVKAELASILDCIVLVSGGDYRLALVTIKDNITIHDNFAPGNAGIVGPHILGLFAGGGAGAAEASDEALRTVVDTRTKAAADAVPPPGNHQNVDFTPAYRPGVLKIAILVTDAPPAGFNDIYTLGVDDVNAHAVALDALGKDIKISAIFVPTGGDYAGQAAIMKDYADVTGGIYTQTNADGSGTGDAIIKIILGCGSKEIAVNFDAHPTSCPNPLNVGSKGVFPGAILGSSSVDVTKIDPASVKLNGVPALRWAYEDVATPFVGPLVDCKSCTTLGADGNLDLTLKWDTQALVAALGAVSDGDCIKVKLTGNLKPEFGGTPIAGADVVRIIKKGKTLPTWEPDAN